MRILAIDPGTERSGWVVTGQGNPPPVEHWAIDANADLLSRIRVYALPIFHVAVIERFAAYDRRIGNETIEAIRWGAKFEQVLEDARGIVPILMLRRDVKRQLCTRVTARDADVREALIERYGPGKTKAIGKKAAKGPLYGVKRDVWAALALAVAWQEMEAEKAACAKGGDDGPQ